MPATRTRKQKMKQITLLLPEVLIERLKEQASQLGIGYQTLIRIKLMNELLQETDIERGRGKPKGARIKARGEKLVSDMVIEDRR